MIFTTLITPFQEKKHKVPLDYITIEDFTKKGLKRGYWGC